MQEEDLDNEVFISDLEDRSTHGPPDYSECACHAGHSLASPLGVMPLEHLIIDYFKKKIYAIRLYLSQEDADALFQSEERGDRVESTKKQHTPVEIMTLTKLDPGTGYLEFLNENHDEVDYVVQLHISNNPGH